MLYAGTNKAYVRQELVFAHQNILSAFQEKRARLLQSLLLEQNEISLVIFEDVIRDRGMLVDEGSFKPVLEHLCFSLVQTFLEQECI